MTLKERLDMLELKLRMLTKNGHKCEVCNRPISLDMAQLAHRIPKTKHNVRTYGKEVVHHEKNMAIVCSLKCNDAVLLNIATHPIESQKLINDIRLSL